MWKETKNFCIEVKADDHLLIWPGNVTSLVLPAWYLKSEQQKEHATTLHSSEYLHLKHKNNQLARVFEDTLTMEWLNKEVSSWKSWFTLTMTILRNLLKNTVNFSLLSCSQYLVAFKPIPSVCSQLALLFNCLKILKEETIKYNYANHVNGN